MVTTQYKPLFFPQYVVQRKRAVAVKDAVCQITVHGEIVAEIRTPPEIKPGEAAARLLDLRKQHGSKKYKTKPVSENIKEYLYAAEGN